VLTLDDIKEIDRFQEPPQTGALCDLLWSDPDENYSSDDVHTTFEYNETRGCSYTFGYRAVVDFLERNKLLSVIRAHEAQDAGYKMHAKNKETQFPTVITIFSAPNYLDAYGNKGAVLRYENTVMNIRQFNHMPHPYWLPNFMNVFAWSIPFVAEKVVESLVVLLKVCGDEEDKEPEPAPQVQAPLEPHHIDAERKAVIRKKILAASKMLRLMRTLRSEHETIVQLKAIAPGNKIPQGLLSQGPAAIQNAVGHFLAAKEMDKINEKRPANEQAESQSKED